MGEWELLERAARAMFAAVCMPVGSVERCLLWAAHDAYMGELRQRAYRVLATAGHR
ncbi:MAG: hypothetical protein ACRDRJ_32830 [Streptosporangiaceae bacterium]